MALTVSAKHIDPRWQLDAVPFAISANGEWDQSYRVSGSFETGGYYAIATNFGCGHNAPTPERAIRSLLQANGCTAINIERAA